MTGLPGSAMIFAAGYGTRMGDLVADRPKPMLPVGGRPMIDTSVELLRAAGIERIVANTHYLHERIAPHLNALGLAVVRETPEILDTGGGLKNALVHLGSGPVITMNPDAGWRGPNPVKVLKAAWTDDTETLLLVVPLERALGRKSGGDFHLDAGELSRGGDFVYTGLQILRTDRVRRHPERVFSLNAVWDRLIDEGRLKGVVYPGDWCDIGHAEGLDLANRMVSGHV